MEAPSDTPVRVESQPVDVAGPAERCKVGRRPKFPRYGRLPRGLAVPGSAPRELHAVAGAGAFNPPGREKRSELATASPPSTGDFGAFSASGGALWMPPR